MRSNMLLGGITTIIVVFVTIHVSTGVIAVSDNVHDDKTVAALHQVSESLECLGDILQDTVNVSKKNNDVVEKMTKVATEKISQAAEHLDEHKILLINMNKDLKQAISSAGTDKILQAANKLDEHKLLIIYMKDDLQKAISNAVSDLTEEIRNSGNNGSSHGPGVGQLTAEIERLRNEVASKGQQVESQNKILEAAGECVREQKIAELVQQANSSQNWTALHSDLQQLLDQGSVAYRQLQSVTFDRNPLYEVGESGYTELASVLLSGGISVEMECNANGDTVLHLAAIRGHLQLVKLLLMNGADIDAKNKAAGLTPLLLAATRGHLEVVKWLVRAGADTTIKQKFGRSALDLASLNGHVAVAKFLEKVQQLSL